MRLHGNLPQSAPRVRRSGQAGTLQIIESLTAEGWCEIGELP